MSLGSFSNKANYANGLAFKYASQILLQINDCRRFFNILGSEVIAQIGAKFGPKP
jgi:hypothetical protein